MKLRDYEWSGNPRGLHNSGPFRPFNAERYLRPHLGWAKLVAGGDEYIEEAAYLVENGCIPIVRIYRSNMGAMAASGEWYEVTQRYIEAGVRWFELYNEPNTDEEWPQGPDGRPVVNVTWENVAMVVAPLMDNWLDWAERIIDSGGYPGFPALAAHGDRTRSTVYWLNAFMQYLRTTHRDRFMVVAYNGLWCATHPQMLNHFYQEPPGGPPHVARPYYQQSAEEPGWHFEYPYDPILQRFDPERTVIGGTPGAPYGEPKGLVAAGEAFQLLLNHHFGIGPVPVVGTAGGITPIPHPGQSPLQPDGRYPGYSRESHGEAILALWKWIVHEGPPWFFGLTLSDEAEYYDTQGAVPAIERMAETPPLLREMADIVMGEEMITALPAVASQFDSDMPSVVTAAAALAEERDDSEYAEVSPTDEAEPPGEVSPALEGHAEPPNAASDVEAEASYAPTEQPIDSAELAYPGPLPAAPLGLAAAEPDQHWLVFGPDVDPAWFFDGAWRYWQAFHPTVTARWEDIALVPPGESLVVTLLASSDTLDALAEQLRQHRPGVRIDPVECDVPEELAAELAWRAGTGRPTG